MCVSLGRRQSRPPTLLFQLSQGATGAQAVAGVSHAQQPSMQRGGPQQPQPVPPRPMQAPPQQPQPVPPRLMQPPPQQPQPVPPRPVQAPPPLPPQHQVRPQRSRQGGLPAEGVAKSRAHPECASLIDGR